MNLETETLARKEADYRHARKRADIAYINMTKARIEIESAKEEMNNYREEKVRLEDEYQKIWEEYDDIRDKINPIIVRYVEISRIEHGMMCEAFDLADRALEDGDYAKFEDFKEQALFHQDCRDQANHKVAHYKEIIRKSKSKAEESEANIITRKFYDAKRRMNDAKRKWGDSYDEYLNFEAESKRLEAEVEEIKSRRREKKGIIYEKEAERKKQHIRILRASTIPEAFYGNVKVKRKSEGGIITYNIYYNTADIADGLNHGHSVVIEVGGKLQETYHRPPLSERGRQNVISDQPETSG